MTASRSVGAAIMMLALSACATSSPSRAIAVKPRTFVVVHGAWGGGWAFKPLGRALAARGHQVYRPTLTGLGERVHLAAPDVDLSTHIKDVVNTVVFEDLKDVVLVGHSYGGMVISGVVNEIPERIRCLIFVDAFLPEDGESLVTASRGQEREAFVQHLVASAENGLISPPGGPSSPRDVPQPVRTLTEVLTLKNPAARSIPGAYVLTVEAGLDAEDDSFAPFAGRAKDRGWPVVVMTAGHVPEGAAWEELARILGDLSE